MLHQPELALYRITWGKRFLNEAYLRCTYLQESSFHAMISSFHAMIPSFHGMISSFHAVFGLRQRDKSAKVIDYNDQGIRVRE